MRMRLSESKRFGLGAAALGAAFGWPLDACADPATPAPTEQQRAEKETELRGVEDTMRASDEQRRAIEAQIEFDPRRPCEAFRGADRDDRESAGG